MLTTLFFGAAFAKVTKFDTISCTDVSGGTTCDDTCANVGSTCTCTTISACSLTPAACDAAEDCATYNTAGGTLNTCTVAGGGTSSSEIVCEDDSSSGGVSCFSPNSGVETPNGVIPMSDLRAGDSVRVGPNSFSEVVGFIHRDLTEASDFIVFNNIFEVSAYHLIETNIGYKHAANVELGMFLNTVDGEVEVESIGTVTRTGYISPLTKSGTIAVDGFLASNYAHVPENLHWLADLMMYPRKCFTYESESNMDSYSYWMNAILHPPFKALHGGYAAF